MLLSLLAICAFAGCAVALPETPCEKSRRPYTVEDTEYCDKYYTCEEGETIEEFCPDGLVYGKIKGTCDLPHTVECEDRQILREPMPTENCPRMNGMFIVEGTCDQFYHCTDGQHTLITCPPGIIFDPKVGACVHADSVSRTDCAATKVLDFECPNAGRSFVPLRFGDHDRLPHPTSCRHFFMCLMSGQPRLGGCSLGLVFNAATGRCDRPKNVFGCEKFYGDMLEDEDIDIDAIDDSANVRLSKSSIIVTTLKPVVTAPVKVDASSNRKMPVASRFGRNRAQSGEKNEDDLGELKE